MSSPDFSHIKALLFDVFGTVVDWQGSVHRLLEKRVKSEGIELGDIDLLKFTQQWRAGYMRRTQEIAAGADGPTNVDELHRELLDDLLSKSEYSTLGEKWSEEDRVELVDFWHQLDGWPASSSGLHAIKEMEKADRRVLLGTLSNGSLRLLVDLARHADLPYDLIFSGDLLGAYKPNPLMYTRACSLLGMQPSEVGMVAAHVYDLQAAAKIGMRTIYIPRETEDLQLDKSSVKSKSEGGEVDVVCKDLGELRGLFE